MEKCDFCGSEERWVSKSSPIRTYFHNLKLSFFKPRQFFAHLSPLGDGYSALSFAIVTHWIYTVIAYFLSLQSEPKNDFFSLYFQFGSQNRFFEPRLSVWLQGLWPVLLDPFFTLIKVVLFSVFLFIPLRIFVTPGKKDRPSQIELSLVIRVVSYLSVVFFFKLINDFAFSILGTVYLWIALREVYRLGGILIFCVLSITAFFSAIAFLTSFLISGLGQLFSFFL